ASARATRASWSSRISRPMIRAWSRRYIRPSVAIWSLRERPARSLPPSSGPSRSSRPRSSAVCTSSSATVPVKAPDSTSASSRSSPSSIRVSSSSVSSPALCSTRAWAREPAMSYGASRQSKCTDAESAASASDGPSAKRPPHSRVSFAMRSALEVTLGGDLRRHAVDVDEALGRGLVEGVAGVVRGQVEVVERLPRPPSGDDGPAAVQGHPDVAGDVLVGLVDEAVQGPLERGEPLAVVDQFAPALLDLPLEAGEFALDGDVLQLLVRGDQRDGAGGLVDLAGLDADQPVLDHVDPADALGAGPLVELLDGLEDAD